MVTLGLDIGGASLKAVDSEGRAAHRRFSLWRQPDQLATQLHALTQGLTCDRLAVTMTGELCDCFATKSEGVRAILDAVEQVFAGKEIHVWQNLGRFVNPVQARAEAWNCASANWSALATYAARFSGGLPALLIDMGSTTTDFIPIRDGRPISKGKIDSERLASAELFYQGVERTPLCAIVRSVNLDLRVYFVMAEFFATTLDVYLTLGSIPEDPHHTATADGRPATKMAARDRLARMIGSDRTRFSNNHAQHMAEQVEAAQLIGLRLALDQVVQESLPRCEPRLILSGQGEFLTRKLPFARPGLEHCEIISLSEKLSPQVSNASCAFAVACLLDEQHPA